MQTTIYFPTLFVLAEDEVQFFEEHFKKKFSNLQFPDGFELVEFKFMEDPMTTPLLEDFIKVNNPHPKKTFHSDNNLMRYTFEAEDSLLYKELPWFERSFKEVIDSFESICGIVAFYHINEGKDFKTISFFSVFDNAEMNTYLTMDTLEGDFSPIFTYTEILKRHYYTDEPEFYPSWESAKYLLKYGDHSINEVAG